MCRQVGEDVSSLACVLAHLCFVFSHSFWNFSAFLIMEVFWDVLACWPLSATVHYDTKCSVRKIKKKCCTLFFWLSELLRSKINNSDWNVSCKYKCEIYKDCFHKNISKKNAGNIIYLCFLYKYSKTGHDGNTFSASKTRQAIRRRQKSKRIKNIYIVYIPVLLHKAGPFPQCELLSSNPSVWSNIFQAQQPHFPYWNSERMAVFVFLWETEKERPGKKALQLV